MIFILNNRVTVREKTATSIICNATGLSLSSLSWWKSQNRIVANSKFSVDFTRSSNQIVSVLAINVSDVVADIQDQDTLL